MASERDYEKLTTAELFLAAICAGVARWEKFSTGQSGEVRALERGEGPKP